MLVYSIYCIWSSWVCRRWKSKFFSCNFHDVWCMTAASAFCMITMYCSSVDGVYCILDISAFIDRIGMDGELCVCSVYCLQRCVQDRGSGAPVFMILKTACPGFYLFHLCC